MPLQAKLVSTALDIATGDQIITGAGFAPDIALSFVPVQTATGGIADATFGFGVADSPTTQRYIAVSSLDNQGDSRVGGIFGINSFLRMKTPLNAVLFDADFMTFGTDGCTINILTPPAAAWRLQTLFLSHTNKTLQSFIGIFNSDLTVGTQDVTGIGFDNPDAVIFFMSQGYSASGQASDAVPNTTNLMFGWWAGGNQACVGGRQGAGLGISSTKRVYRNNQAIHIEGSTGPVLVANYVQGLTGGFRINITTASGDPWRVPFIALKGLSAKVINTSTPPSAGVVNVNGAGFKPAAVLAMTSHMTASASSSADARRSFGVATGTANRAAFTHHDINNVTVTNVSQRLATDALLENITANHATPTLVDKLDISAFISDGVAIDVNPLGSSFEYSLLMLGPAEETATTILITGIASAAAFGSPTLFTGSQAQTIVPTGIPSAAAFGTLTIGSAKLVQPTSIRGSDVRDVELIGTFDDTTFSATFTQYKVALTTGPDPRSAFVAFGTGTHVFTLVAPGSYNSTWALSNAAGTVFSDTQTDTVIVGNVGHPTIIVGGGPGPSLVVLVGIPSAAAFGNPLINRNITGLGNIPSAEAFGTPTIVTGGSSILPSGIPSAEAFGTPEIITDTDILVIGIPLPDPQFGVPLIEFEGGQTINVVGIETSEAFGTVIMSVPVAPVQWPPIEDPHTVWIRVPRGREG